MLVAEDLHLEPLYLHKKSGMMLCACNSSTLEAEAGGYHELTQQPH